jgi:DNA-binding LacI/PurR family transcriptional regulator
VLAAIAELDCVPNSVARGLVTSRTNSVALVIPESASRVGSEPYFSAVIRGVSTAGAQTRTQLQLVLVRDQPSGTSSPSRWRSGVSTGLLVSVHEHDSLPGLLADMGLPTVLAGRRSPDESLSHVHSDNAGGAATAVGHLLARGRRTVATVSGPLDMDVARSRLQGWRAALDKAGHEAADRLVASADFTEEGRRGRDAFTR